MLPIRALRLTRHDAVSLDRMAFEEGELVYDATNSLIRLMDGDNPGGKKLANQVWATNAISTAITTTNNTLTAAIALKAPINNPGFTGTVTGITATMVGLGNVTNESKTTMFSGPTFTGTTSGTFSGPLTGNVTGNLTGNADTATQLITARNINGVAFNGSINITLSTLVNGSNTITLGTTGTTTFPTNIAFNYSGDDVQFPRIIATSGKAFSVQGQGASGSAALSWTVNPDAASQYAAVAVSKGGGDNLAKVVLQAQSNSGDVGTAKTWKFDETGVMTAPGDITTTTGTVASFTVTANTITTTNAVTVGTNVNISTLPTQPQHASNKKYVDARSVAMSIAMS